jgi:AmmeMemoRadiSam system protein A
VTPRTFTPEQRTTLLEVAADAIRETLEQGHDSSPDLDRFDPALRRAGATFVTLERDAQLLGCIGSLEATRPLVVDVARNAVAAAFRDPRLPPVTSDDYRAMSIEISVLSDLKPMHATSYDELTAEVRSGIDGVVVESGQHRATFLPAVWRHFDGDVGAFLDGLWRKAGLTPGDWPPGTRCSRYTAEKLVDPGPRQITVQGPPGGTGGFGETRTFPLDVAPCTRYYLVAVKTNRLANDLLSPIPLSGVEKIYPKIDCLAHKSNRESTALVLFEPGQTWPTAAKASNANFNSRVAEGRIFHRIAIAYRFHRPII